MSDIKAPALPVWNCQFADGEAKLDALTVGSRFKMNCAGEIPVEWGKEPLRVVFAKDDEQYTLVLLKSEALEPTRAQFEVTGYKPGEHAPEYVRVMQADRGFEALKPAWKIQSVIKSDQAGEPFPPFGPWGLALPYWFMAIVLLALGLAALIAVSRLRKHLQRKRMLEDLKRHTTAMPPLHQFYKDIRALKRRLNQARNAEELHAITDALDREFRLYILRRFQVPTLDWSDRAILDDLRRRHRPVYRSAGDAIKKTLRELGRIRGQQKLLLPDVEQLHRMSLDTVERSEESAGGAR